MPSTPYFPLAPHQGFWIRTSGASPGDFTFSASQAKTTESFIDIVSAKKGESNDNLILTAKSTNNNNEDQVSIFFRDDASDLYDNMHDAYKLKNASGYPMIMVKQQNTTYSICLTNNNTKVFDVIFEDSDNNENYEISCDASQLSSFSQVVLFDKKTGSSTDLSSGLKYSFTNDTSYPEDVRFTLSFEKGTLDSEELSIGSFKTYYANGRLNIENNLEVGKIMTVEIYDLSGRMIFTDNFKNEHRFDVQIPKSLSGVAIVKLNFDNRYLGSNKVFIN